MPRERRWNCWKKHFDAGDLLPEPMQLEGVGLRLEAKKKMVADAQYRESKARHHVSSTGPPASGPRPFIIPIFLPHAGCPYQCVFCNQVSITGTKKKLINTNELRSQIREFLAYGKKNRTPIEVAFFGGNFLGLNTEKIESLLGTAAEFVEDGSVDGIRFSTRPDTIDSRGLDIITDYPVSTVELGVQSMVDHVLALVRRGHSAADTVRAVERLNKGPYRVGLQMMVGLPGDDETGALTTAQKLIDLSPDFVRIYPTVVIANSRLAGWYERGDYRPLSLEESVALVKKIYLKFNKAGIGVIRMGLQPSGDLEDGTNVLAGPYHPAFGHLVYSEIFLDAACAAIKSADLAATSLAISVNPRRISVMKGMKNSNIERLKRRFQVDKIDIITDSSIDEHSIKVVTGSLKLCFRILR